MNGLQRAVLTQHELQIALLEVRLPISRCMEHLQMWLNLVDKQDYGPACTALLHKVKQVQMCSCNTTSAFCSWTLVSTTTLYRLLKSALFCR